MPRTLLIAVDNDERSRLMWAHVLQHEVAPEDTLHLVHVSMRDTSNGALPAGDYFDQAHPQTAHKVVQEMLHTHYVTPLQAAFPGIQHTVHVVQAAQDVKTVGRIICEKAQQLQADQAFIGGKPSHCRQRSRIAELLTGSSVPAYVQQHCKVPVTVVVQEGGSGGPHSLQDVSLHSTSNVPQQGPHS